jgi:putative transposase
MKKFKNQFPIERMAKVFGVTRDSYYKWIYRNDSKRKIEDRMLTDRIKQIFYLHKKRYGSTRIQRQLKKEGFICSRRRVAKLMKLNNLISIRKKKYKPNSKHNNPISPNLLNQNFNVNEPDKIWVSDITYIRTFEGWVYLTTVIDLFNREVIGFSISNNLKTKNTVIKAFDSVIRKRTPKSGLIFHSDQGSQYTDRAFRKRLNRYGITQSMSDRGNCYDNAVAESFFKTLKSELTEEIGIYRTKQEARISLLDYIELYYNTKRIHSTLDFVAQGSIWITITNNRKNWKIKKKQNVLKRSVYKRVDRPIAQVEMLG